MIVRARTVVTMNGAPIKDGGVRVLGDRIADIGQFTELSEQVPSRRTQTKRAADEEVIDLGNSVLLPGLINAHCHFDYTCLRGKIPSPHSFAEWIRAINSEKAKLTSADYLQSIAEGIAEAQRFGTTSVVNLAGFPELIPEIPVVPLRIWWCAELIDVTAQANAADIVSKAVATLKFAAANGLCIGLAPHALFTASKAVYRTCAEVARREKFLLTTHLAESKEEMQMFDQGSGPLFDFIRSIGRPMDDCEDRTPLSVFLENLRSVKSENVRTQPLLAKWIVAHLNELAAGDFEVLSTLPAEFSVVHCPRSHAYFGHKPFAFERLDDLGVNVCLGTDSLASNADLSLFREMREFRRRHSAAPSHKILKMVTVNAAKALGQADRLGKISPEYEADMIALPFGGGNVYDSILSFDAPIPWAMIGGKVINFSGFPLSFSQN